MRYDEQNIVSENAALHCVSFLLMPSCLREEIAKYCKGQDKRSLIAGQLESSKVSI